MNIESRGKTTEPSLNAKPYENEIKTFDLVKPWQTVVKPQIEKHLAAAWLLNDDQNQQQIQDDADFFDDEEEAAHTTITSGFQQIKTFGHSRTPIRSFLYIPVGSRSERFGTIDANFCNIYSNFTLSFKYIVKTNKMDNLRSSSSEPAQVQKKKNQKGGKGPLPGSDSSKKGQDSKIFEGLDQWIYIERWRIFVITTELLELKIISLDLKEMSTISLEKPIICMHFVDGKQPELIAGTAGSVLVFHFKDVYQYSRRAGSVTLELAYILDEDLSVNDWISHIIVDEKKGLIYAAHDMHVTIFDKKTQEWVITLYDLHMESISAMEIWVSQDYLITASKCSKIKIWNSQHILLYELNDHYKAITGLSIVSINSDTKAKFLISTSLDASIRLWSLEDGSCLARINTLNEVLGLQWMRNGQFCTYSSDRLSIWEVSRFFNPFFSVEFPLAKLKKVQINNFPSRIMALGSNGSVVLASPRTGEKLIVSEPSNADIAIIDGVYDPCQGLIYLLNQNGHIYVQNAAFSPSKLEAEWTFFSHIEDKIRCIAGLPIQSQIIKPLSSSKAYLFYYMILCGTESGELLARDVRDEGFSHFLVQGHSGAVVEIEANSEGSQVFSVSDDSTVKIWRIVYLEADKSRPHLKYVSHLDGKDVSIHLEIISVIHTNPLVPTIVAGVPMGDFFAAATSIKKLAMYRKKSSAGMFELVPSQSGDDGHANTITAMSWSHKLELLATCSHDGSVKIWDTVSNRLIRELQFERPLDTIEFISDRGDLLVSFSTEVVLVCIQDYLPNSYLKKIVKMAWTDDIMEHFEYFDPSSAFWKRNRDKNNLAGTHWYLAAQMEQMIARENAILELVAKRRNEELSPLVAIIRRWPGDLKYKNVWEVQQDALKSADSVPAPVMQNEQQREAKIERRKTRIFDVIEKEVVDYVIPEMDLATLMSDAAFTEPLPTYVRKLNKKETESNALKPKKSIQKQKEIKARRFELIDQRKILRMEKEALVRKITEAEASKVLRFKNSDIAKPNAMGQVEEADSFRFNGRGSLSLDDDEDIISSKATKKGGKRKPKKVVPKILEDDSDEDFGRGVVIEVSDEVSKSIGSELNLLDLENSIEKEKVTTSKILSEKPNLRVGVETVVQKALPAPVMKVEKEKKGKKGKKSKAVKKATKSSEKESIIEIQGRMFERAVYYCDFTTPNLNEELHGVFENTYNELGPFILDSRNGFVMKARSVSVVEKPKQIDKKVKQKGKGYNSRNKSYKEELEKKGIDDEERPETPPEPSVVFTYEEKTKVAWSVFQAAILKANEGDEAKVTMDLAGIVDPLPNYADKKLKAKNVARVALMKEIMARNKERDELARSKNGDLQIQAASIAATTKAPEPLPRDTSGDFKPTLGNRFAKMAKNVRMANTLFKVLTSIKEEDEEEEENHIVTEEVIDRFIDQVSKFPAQGQKPSSSSSEAANSKDGKSGSSALVEDLNAVIDSMELPQAPVKKVKPILTPIIPSAVKPARGEYIQALPTGTTSPKEKSLRSALEESLDPFAQKLFRASVTAETPIYTGAMAMVSPSPKTATYSSVPPTPSIEVSAHVEALSNAFIEDVSIIRRISGAIQARKDSIQRTAMSQMPHIEEKLLTVPEAPGKETTTSADDIDPKEVTPPPVVKRADYRSMLERMMNEGDIVESLQAAEWFPNLKGQKVNISTIIEGLLGVFSSPNADDSSKIDAGMCIRFLVETFRSDVLENEEKVRNFVAVHIDALDLASDRVKVQLILNIAATNSTSESVFQALIVCLSSKSRSVVRTALEALGNIGICSSDDLEDKMQELQMFPNVVRIKKTKFIHPLEPIMKEREREREAELAKSLIYVQIWRKGVDPRTSGPELTRTESSIITFIPKTMKALKLKKKVLPPI